MTRHAATLSPAAALILAVGFVATPAQAQQAPGAAVTKTEAAEKPAHRIFVELRVPTRYATDASFDALSDDNAVTTAQLGAGYDLSRWTVDGLRAYLLYSSVVEDVDRFSGTVGLAWTQYQFLAAADWGPTLWQVLRPSVRLGGGYSLQEIELDIDTGQRDDFAHDVIGFGAVGVTALTPPGLVALGQFGLSTQVGYSIQTAATFDELDSEDGGGWDRRDIVLGDLDTDGVFWDVGATWQYAF